jgi:RNA polymerase sigma factor (sigma-70 family)
MMTPEHAANDMGMTPERATADMELIAQIQYQGPGSPLARRVEEHLARYGLATLMGMAQSGRLRGVVMRRTHRHLDGLSPGNADELVINAVGGALPRFMQTYVFEGRWDPKGGAALATLFITACCFSLVDESRRMERMRRRRNEFLVDDLKSLGELDHAWSANVNLTDPEAALLDRESRNELLAPLGQRARLVIENLADGRTYNEIAGDLDISADGVRKIAARARAKVKEELKSRSIDQRSDRPVEPDSLRETQARLSRWRITGVEDAVKARAAIERQRSMYEDPRKTALYRPVPGVAKNQLDIILDEIPVEPPVDRTRWAANNARVCRALLASVREVLPIVQRPNDRVKGLVRDVQELYRDLKIASMAPRLH